MLCNLDSSLLELEKKGLSAKRQKTLESLIHVRDNCLPEGKSGCHSGHDLTYAEQKREDREKKKN